MIFLDDLIKYLESIMYSSKTNAIV